VVAVLVVVAPLAVQQVVEVVVVRLLAEVVQQQVEQPLLE